MRASLLLLTWRGVHVTRRHDETVHISRKRHLPDPKPRPSENREDLTQRNLVGLGEGLHPQEVEWFVIDAR